MKQMYHPDDLASMDPLVLMRNLDHVRMTSRRLSYILQQQVHLYTPEANKIRTEIDQYVEAERQIEWEMARRGLRSQGYTRSRTARERPRARSAGRMSAPRPPSPPASPGGPRRPARACRSGRR